jgi:riboflavin biosynthesis pyrimidine reductase
MMGGAGSIGSFLDADELDEFIIHVIPKFIGEGIPLIAPRHRMIGLSSHACRRYSDGVVRLHYTVSRPRSSKPSVGHAQPQGASQPTARRTGRR